MAISYRRLGWQVRVLRTLDDAQSTGQEYLTTRQLIIRCGDRSREGQNVRQCLSRCAALGIVERLGRGIYALPQVEK